MSGRALRGAFYAGGAVATAAGLHTILTGGRSLPDRALRDPVAESELRFYAAFYVAYGAALLRVAPRADRDIEAPRALAAALFLAGVARLAAWRATGRPHPLQLGLLGAELALPPALLAAQSRIARGP